MGKYYSVHSYKHLVAQCRAMHNGAMPNCTLITNRERRVGVYMQRAIILDVAAVTNDDWRGISAYDGVVPDTCTFANSDISYYHGAGGDKDIFFYSGHNTLVW